MAEIIGLVASVVQLADAGLKLSSALYQYADGVATADRRIKNIANEVKLTSFVIQELGGIFEQNKSTRPSQERWVDLCYLSGITRSNSYEVRSTNLRVHCSC